MAIEIEKKFLTHNLPSSLLKKPVFIRQGYMMTGNDLVIRVRLFGSESYITLKGKTVNTARKEFEYPIPREDAIEMLEIFCVKPLLEKKRYIIPYKGFKWEVDEFLGDNQGLVVAEIELDKIDQPFEKPDWIGKEVSDDPKYFNSSLVRHPYSNWV